MKNLVYGLLAVGLVLALALTACAKPATAPTPSPAQLQQPPPAPAVKPTPTPAPAPKPAWPKQIRFISGSVGTDNFGMDAYLAGILTRKLNIPVGAFPGAMVTNLPLLNDGEIEFAASVTSNMVRGWKGEKPYDQRLPNIRFMHQRGLFATALVVRVDSKIKTLEDLIGKKIAAGMKGETAELHALATLKAAGITREKIEAAGGVWANMSYGAMGEALLAGTVDAIWLNNPLKSPHSSVALVNERFGARLIPLPAGTLEKGLKENPDLVKAIIKGGTFKGTPDDVPYLGGATQTLTRADLPEGLVYEVIKAIYEPDVSKYIASNFPLWSFMGDTENGLITAEIIPMHPGAAKFWSVDRKVDLKAKGVTVQ